AIRELRLHGILHADLLADAGGAAIEDGAAGGKEGDRALLRARVAEAAVLVVRRRAAAVDADVRHAAVAAVGEHDVRVAGGDSRVRLRERRAPPIERAEAGTRSELARVDQPVWRGRGRRRIE